MPRKAKGRCFTHYKKKKYSISGGQQNEEVGGDRNAPTENPVGQAQVNSNGDTCAEDISASATDTTYPSEECIPNPVDINCMKFSTKPDTVVDESEILLVNVDCSSEETVILGSSYQSEVLCAEPDNITDDAESALNSTNVSEYHDTVVDESEILLVSVDCPSEEIFVPSNSSCQSQVLHAEPETSIIDDPLPALLSPVIPLPRLYDASVWKEAENLFKLFASSNWHTQVDNNSFSIFMLSKGENKVVQRSVVFQYNGKIKVYVHGKPISEKHIFWDSIVSFSPLSAGPARELCDKAVSVVNALKDFQVCVGVPEAEFEYFWSKTPGSHIEEGFEEYRFDRTLRSNDCLYLVSRKRCTKCNGLFRKLKQKSVKRAAVKDGTPNKYKPDRYLTTPESKSRKERGKKNVRNLKNESEKLRKLLHKVERDGVDLDLDLNQQLKAVLDQTKLTPFQKLFIESQVRCGSVKKKCGMKWHPAVLRFALNLKLHSPTAMAVARRYIDFPHDRTLFDYSHRYEAKEGVSLHIIENVVKSIDHTDPHKFNHILSFDEVHISQNLVFNKHTGVMVGYCNLNEAEKEIAAMESALNDETRPLEYTPPMAKHMLSFMVRGVYSSLKEVVASFCVKTLSKEFLFERHWQVVEVLEISGLKIRASVCDGAPTNRAFFQMNPAYTKTKSGVVFDTINMYGDDEPSPRILYFVSDPPHLLKTIRNCLQSSYRKLQKNNELLSWTVITRLYHETKGLTLRKCFKLDAQCVFLSPYSRMKVCYAARVLSKSVAEELKRRGWHGTSELVTFLANVNDFFDILNGAYKKEFIEKNKPLLAPYTCWSDDRLQLLDDFLEYLSKWKTEVENTPGLSDKEKELRFICHQTLAGIEITIRSFQGLMKALLPEHEPEQPDRYIMARIINQDSLEQYFSRQRARCGGSRNPNAAEYLRNQNNLHTIGQVGGLREKGNTKSRLGAVPCDDTPLPKRRRRTARSLLFSNPDFELPE